MSAKCTICAHPRRLEIEGAAVATGASIRAIASQFGVGRDAISRHIQSGHVTKKILKCQKAQDIAEADALLNEIEAIQEAQHKIYIEARDRIVTIKKKGEPDMRCPDPDNKLALEALRDQAKTIEMKGKILGAFTKDKETKGTLVINIEKEDAGL